MRVLSLCLLVLAGIGCDASPRVTDPATGLPLGGTMVAGNRSIGPLTDSVMGTLRETTNPLIVLVLDARGVPIRGVPVIWSAFGGGIVSPLDSVTNAGGEAIAEYTFGAQAHSGYGAFATVEGLSGSPIIFLLRAHAATPTRLEITKGDSLVILAGQKVVHTVTVRDSYGNPTRGVRVGWAIASGGGSLSWTESYTGVDGRAEVTRTLGAQPGKQTVVATALELAGAPQVTFTTITQ